jgi:hypothetical protein
MCFSPGTLSRASAYAAMTPNAMTTAQVTTVTMMLLSRMRENSNWANRSR